MRAYIEQCDGVPSPTSPISHAVVVGNMCWISGQHALDAPGQYQAGTALEEASRCFELLVRVVQSAGFEASEIAFVEIAFRDHWSGWLRVPQARFKDRMAGKRMWAISAYSDTDPALAEPLFDTLRLTASYMKMIWAGSLLGSGNAPGDVLTDRHAVAGARNFFKLAA